VARDYHALLAAKVSARDYRIAVANHLEVALSLKCCLYCVGKGTLFAADRWQVANRHRQLNQALPQI
jgi:hypothetical protein